MQFSIKTIIIPTSPLVAIKCNTDLKSQSHFLPQIPDDNR